MKVYGPDAGKLRSGGHMRPIELFFFIWPSKLKEVMVIVCRKTAAFNSFSQCFAVASMNSRCSGVALEMLILSCKRDDTLWRFRDLQNVATLCSGLRFRRYDVFFSSYKVGHQHSPSLCSAPHPTHLQMEH